MKSEDGSVAEETDEVLIRNALQGDQQAYRKLLERHRHAIFHIAFKIVRNSEEAADLVQEALESLLKNDTILDGLKQYVGDVTTRDFPQRENWFTIKDQAFEELKKTLDLD